MSVHRAHAPRDEHGLPLMDDDCPRCVEQAGELGVHLDEEKWGRAWEVMLGVEMHIGGYGAIRGYGSEADARLCRQLYLMFLVLQRNTTVDPRVLPLVA